jgi:hypothetical protein
MIAAGVAAPNQALCEDQAYDLFCLRIGEGERTLKRRTIYARVSHVFKHAEPVRQRFAEEQMSNTRLDKVVGAHAGRACASVVGRTGSTPSSSMTVSISPVRVLCRSAANWPSTLRFSHNGIDFVDTGMRLDEGAVATDALSGDGANLPGQSEVLR